MKKYIHNKPALFFMVEGLYFLLHLLISMPPFIKAFDRSNIGLYLNVFGVYIITIVLLIYAGIGLVKGKNWGITCAWVAILLPQVVKLFSPYGLIPLRDNYFFSLVNILMLVYISRQWGKLKAE